MRPSSPIRSDSVEHVLPRLGDVLDPVLAVPEQLGVRGERRGVERVLERGSLDHAVEGAVGHLLLELTLPWLEPAGVRELGGPDHVHPDDVDRGVLGAEAPDELLALAVSVRRQELERDRVLAVRLLRALGGRLLEGAARLVEDEERKLGSLPRLVGSGAGGERKGGHKQGNDARHSSNLGTWVQPSSSRRRSYPAVGLRKQTGPIRADASGGRRSIAGEARETIPRRPSGPRRSFVRDPSNPATALLS